MNTRLKMAAVFAVVFALLPFVPRLIVKGQAEDRSVLLLTEDGERLELSEREYVIGAVFASLPADSPEEALKAQAVLARTYLERRRAEESKSPTKELEGCLFSDDTSKYNAYFSEKEAAALCGPDYARLYGRVAAAADYAMDKCLTYDGEPITAPFHAESDGRTLSALEAWGEDIPYLRGTDCPHDSEGSPCVGLSQHEMLAMAESGASCEEILSKFFSNAQFTMHNAQ